MANRVALLLLAYNQESIVRDSALACLAQECEPLDVIFSDDASKDGTFEVLQEVAAHYKGPHRLMVRKNDKNLGIGGHLNALIAATESEFIIASAGDDISLPNRAKSLITAWDETNRKVDLVSSHCTRMLYDGSLAEQVNTSPLEGLTPMSWAINRPYIIGATHAFTKRLYEAFGPLNPDVGREDQILVFRAICRGGAVTIDQPLVKYRDGGVFRGAESMSSEKRLTLAHRNLKLDIAEMRQLIQDAKIANQNAALVHVFEEKLKRDLFLEEILRLKLDRQSLAPMLRIAKKHGHLPLAWRCKKILTTLFYDFYTSFQHHNRNRRQFIRKFRER